MPGIYTLKPIQANLTRNTNFFGKMNPYCNFILGNTMIRSEVCLGGGKNPHWDEAITIPLDEKISANILVQLIDKDKVLDDVKIGDFILELPEVKERKHLSRWYPISYKTKPAGEILIESDYQGDELHIERKQPVSTYTEQTQVIEPHTFIKEVEVVETRSGLKEIEVMRPVKVIKHVQVTEPVVVRKMMEVTEPEIVLKEIEVMEPTLVTKTIQVVEEVPVIRQVEVVEMRSRLQLIDSVESQIVTKEVEVIEYVPVKRQVEVSEPVTVKRTVEYVEPVTTTVTITKEIPQEVIVSEEVTMTVGMASVVEKKEVKKPVKSQIVREDVIVVKTVEQERIVIETNLETGEEEVMKDEATVVRTFEEERTVVETNLETGEEVEVEKETFMGFEVKYREEEVEVEKETFMGFEVKYREEIDLEEYLAENTKVEAEDENLAVIRGIAKYSY